ncbi:MAG: hypothetical protein JO057_06665 [Chloroflexi bacterium]|nr:hypothetical protein [Chloroflexota bacterium]
MLELTGAMRTELQRLAEHLKNSNVALRLTRDHAGRLHLVPDTAEPGDIVLLQPDSLPALIATPQVATDAEGGILHFHALADERYDGAALVLLRPRSGTPRPTWSLPQTAKAPARDFRAVFRRAPAPASTTQSASL